MKGMKCFWHVQGVVFNVHKRKKNLLALYALIKTTSGTQGERPFLCTLLTILLLSPCCLTISGGQKPVNKNKSLQSLRRDSITRWVPTKLQRQPQKFMRSTWWIVAITGGLLQGIFIGSNQMSYLKSLAIFSFTNFYIFLEILKPPLSPEKPSKEILTRLLQPKD